ncbi:hypothetical protein NL676_036046 [Syzygium grande]|nr:hypothetical protein NL676_036046 [Syzygium grande]
MEPTEHKEDGGSGLTWMHSSGRPRCDGGGSANGDSGGDAEATVDHLSGFNVADRRRPPLRVQRRGPVPDRALLPAGEDEQEVQPE